MKQNRLGKEKSPYLLQHSYNPVDWCPWGEEAFEKAKQEGKPIFLSIGYAACHWCHVMEEESFSDDEVAALLNDAFVCIKVDRQERPDIDATYMGVCQLLTGSGGWPLTIIMTPEKKPFFAATYLPKHVKYGQVGIIELASRIKQLWKTRRKELEVSAEGILASLQENSEHGELDPKIIDRAYAELSQRFDAEHGGFDTEPKFPTAHILLFLLRYWKRTKDSRALDMVEKTLLAMRFGGIYDHIGFGFHRYSTDAQWHIPHFEKMLYDQAMLALAYTEAYQVTKKKEYKQTAKEILAYVLRDMVSEEGGFYAAEDADSEGVEGKFYVWGREEIKNILGKDGETLCSIFSIEDEKENILHISKQLTEREQVLWSAARQKLFAAREKRARPLKDDQVLTDWNGLMIAALAKAGAVFGESKYIDAAKHAAALILTRCKDGKLQHNDGIMGFLDDYAFFIWGLLELYEATFDVHYLQTALKLNKEVLTHFLDRQNGGFYITAEDSEVVLQRRKEWYDSALPSGNAVTMFNLLRFNRITGDRTYEDHARMLGQAFPLSNGPSAYAFFMIAIDFLADPSYVVVTANKEIIRELRRHFIPKMIILYTDPALIPITSLIKDKKDGNMAYVCHEGACLLPTNDVKKVLEQLHA